MRWIYGIISALMLTGGAVSPTAADVSAPVESTGI
jgi:hypothetical protein